jgi:hypothetical protein
MRQKSEEDLEKMSDASASASQRAVSARHNCYGS